MIIDTSFLERCIATLEKAHSLLLKHESESIDYEMYRSACIKEFEIILEQSGKLLRKILKPYFHSPKEADKLTFKDIFRNAVLRGLMSDNTCERWMNYRDNRNSTAHDYGVNFANETLSLLPNFIDDAKELVHIIKNNNPIK
jgi:nucleotidyltransferase substrate binding protein (TIGR01987 family)